MAWPWTRYCFLLICLLEVVVGEEVCYSPDLRAVAVRLREVATKCHDSTEALKDDISRLQKDNLALQSSVYNLDTRASVSALEDEISKLKGTTTSMKEEIANMTNKYVNIEINARNSSDSIGEVVKEIEDLKRGAIDLQTSFQNLESHDSITALQEGISNLADTLKEEINGYSSDTSASVAHLEGDLQTLNDSIKTLRTSYHGLETMTVEIAERVKEVDNIEDRVNESAAVWWRTELEQKMNETMKTVHQDIDDVKLMVVESNTGSKNITEYVAKLQEDLDNEQNESKAYEAKLERLNVKMKELEVKINATIAACELDDKRKWLDATSQGLNRQSASFIARKPSNNNPASGEILIFNIEELDTNGAYDNTTGKFRAPVAGTYLFSVQMCIREESGIFYKIKSSLNTHIASFHGGNYRNNECSSATTVARLAMNEEVWVESGLTVGNDEEIYFDDNAWNMFTGILISPIL